MATEGNRIKVIENIKFEEAVQKSKSAKDNSYHYEWLVKENVINMEGPEGKAFVDMAVIWDTTFTSYRILVRYSAWCMGYVAKDDGNTFFEIDELREKFPKLFEITGRFYSYLRRII